jgi:Protein of unknown function (DUF1566)
MCKKKSYVVIAAVVVAVVTMLVFFPPTGTAGSLDPTAAPAPTMKTLDQIPPTWSQTITDGTRFQSVFGGAGVLDKETGLVWEQSPNTVQIWANAIGYCHTKNVGGRLGWHLPTIEQLASLVDRSVAGLGLTLPSGHPFTGVQSNGYWSATTSANNTTYAWAVGFGNGSVGYVDKASDYYVWCVRGGQTYDGQ